MHLLIAEENVKALARMSKCLGAAGHQVTRAQDGMIGLHLAAIGNYDAVIFSTTLPGIDGVQACSRLREGGRHDLPIILTSKQEGLPELLHGFKAGADDYLKEPFHLDELMARIKAIIKRMGRNADRVLRTHDLTYDLDTLTVKRSGQCLQLNPMSLLILELFMRKSPAVVTRKELEHLIWQGDEPNGNSLRSNVHLLRCVIDKPFEFPLIHTLHGLGYQLAYKQGVEVCLAEANIA